MGVTQQVEQVKQARNNGCEIIGAAVSTRSEDRARVDALARAGIDAIVIDSAQGVRVLAVGAGTVMLGRLLAGSDEASGWGHDMTGEREKCYRGMASEGALLKGGDKRYSTTAGVIVPQGVETKVSAAGPVRNTLARLRIGMQQALQDVGVQSISELQSSGIRVEMRSPSAQIEGSPHILRGS